MDALRSTKKICISFDWHNDRNYRYMLRARFGILEQGERGSISSGDQLLGAVELI